MRDRGSRVSIFPLVFEESRFYRRNGRKDLMVVLSLIMKQLLVLIIFHRNPLALRIKPRKERIRKSFVERRRFLSGFYGVMKPLRLNSIIIITSVSNS